MNYNPRHTVQRKNAASTLRFQTAFLGSEWKRFNNGCFPPQINKDGNKSMFEESDVNVNANSNSIPITFPLIMHAAIKLWRSRRSLDAYLHQIPNIWSIIAMCAKNRICILLVLLQNLEQKWLAKCMTPKKKDIVYHTYADWSVRLTWRRVRSVGGAP